MTTKNIQQMLEDTRALLEDGNCPEAIAKLGEALVDFPDEGLLWDMLGVAYWDAGAVQDSIDALEHASMLVPLSPEGQLALALGYEVAQKHELSTELLTGLAARDNLSPNVLEQLARALGRAGDSDVALHVCERAAQLQPESTAPLLGIVFYMARLGASSRQMLPTLFRALHLDPTDSAIRILLARRLHDCNLSEDAAEVLRLVDLSTYACPNCLHAMHEIFVAAGDETLAAQCTEVLMGSPYEGKARP